MPDEYSFQEICIGEVIPEDRPIVPVIFHDPVLGIKHRNTPWLHDYLENHEGIQPGNASRAALTRMLTIEDDLLSRHSMVIGKSGSGKSRLILHLLLKQIEFGRSLVMIDPKHQSIQQFLALFEEFKSSNPGRQMPEITLIWPRQSTYGVPSWNPLLGDSSYVRKNVSSLVGIMSEIFPVTGDTASTEFSNLRQLWRLPWNSPSLKWSRCCNDPNS